MEEKFAREVREVFNIEAREHCENLEKMLLNLEKNLNNSSMVDHIFRVVHTLKGSAFAADLNEIAHLAHEMETTLHYFKEGLLEIDREKVELLLRTNDHLLQTVASDQPDKKSYLSLFQSLKKINNKIGHRKKLDEKSKIDQSEKVAWLTEENPNNQQTASTQPAFIFKDYKIDWNSKGFNFFHLKISLPKIRKEPSIVEVFNQLSEYGVIVQTIIDGKVVPIKQNADIEKSKLVNVVFATKLSKQVFLEKFGIDERSCDVTTFSEELVTANSWGGVFFL